jgi:uncharacterized damage-inducible protein DinB
MTHTEIDTLTRPLEAAYRFDTFHALLENLSDVRENEWAALPANHSAEVFGTSPDLSIAHIVKHVGAAKLMWGNHTFGDASLTWLEAKPSSMDHEPMLEWVDAAHRAFVADVAALEDDRELAVDRTAHSGRPLPTRQIISIVINHDLYHSGEINRQRALIRGADGWEQPA